MDRQPRRVGSMKHDVTLGTCEPSNGVLVLSGFGLRVAVQRGHLLVTDGLGRDRRRGQFPRVGHGIRRIVVLGHSGTVSFEALRWMHELDIAFVQLGRDGELIAIGAPNALVDVRLRRAQALAMHSDGGLAIARELLLEKVNGQARVLDFFNGQAEIRRAMSVALDMIAESRSMDELRFVESRAAAAYWSAWENVPVHFAGREAKHVPAHWRTFGTRRS